jgi:hypothetical protein
MNSLTKSQSAALKWLREHGGDGAFVRGGATILAAGEIAPFERKTWEGLRNAGLVVFYGGAQDGGRGWGRARLA